MAETPVSLESLGARVAELSKTLTKQLKALGSPLPSFDENAPGSLPASLDIQGPRTDLLKCLHDLWHLTIGPQEYWTVNNITSVQDSLTVDVLNDFDFIGAVPLGGSASYADIAEYAKLPEPLVRRVLRNAMIQHLFTEDSTGRVVHTAATAHAARSPAARAFSAHCLKEVRSAAVEEGQSLRKFFAGRKEMPGTVAECAFPLSCEDGKPRGVNFFEYLETWDSGKRSRRFAEGMEAVSASLVTMEATLASFAWESLGEAKVVDLGGGGGDMGILLAKKYPKLRVVVQDLMQASADRFHAQVPGEVAGRVSFQLHDFFTAQPVADADVFFMKWVLHDWPDKAAADIVGRLVPALRARQGARIIICDIILPPSHHTPGQPSAPWWARRLLFAADLQMHVLQNSKERTKEDWIAVIKQADQDLDLVATYVVPGAPFSLMEVALR